jgi:general secretion pathway protein A
MYESHYGLTAKPFSIVPNPEMLFLSRDHQNALTYLEYGLSEKTGFILLTGEIGTGKTTLIRYMLNQVESQMDVAAIFNTNFSSSQLLRRILSEFEVSCDSSEKARQLELLYRFLVDRYARKRPVLLILDEAQNLSDKSLENLRMLSNLQTDDQILMQIMLVGQPELKNRLELPGFRQFAQRIAVSYHIGPLDEEQTSRYIAYRLGKVGGSPDLFTPKAVKKIFEYAKGTPRTTNLICDTALVYGFADNLTQIDAGVIEKVSQDKVCLSIEGSPPVKPEAQPLSKSREPEILERIHLLEKSIAELTRQHEAFVGEIRKKLFSKFQELLTIERKRFDRLMEEHSRLVKMVAAESVNGVMAEGNSGEAKKRVNQ